MTDATNTDPWRALLAAAQVASKRVSGDDMGALREAVLRVEREGEQPPAGLVERLREAVEKHKMAQQSPPPQQDHEQRVARADAWACKYVDVRVDEGMFEHRNSERSNVAWHAARAGYLAALDAFAEREKLWRELVELTECGPFDRTTSTIAMTSYDARSASPTARTRRRRERF